MNEVRVQLLLRGLNVLMRSAEVQKVVDESGERIRSAAGKNFEYVHAKKSHRWVARGYVQAKNAAGRREEAVSKQLTRAVGKERS